MDTHQLRSRSRAQNAADKTRVDQSSQGYEMLRLDESQSSLDLSIRSWNEPSRLSNARQKDIVPSDDAKRKPATNCAQHTQYSAENKAASSEAADSLLRSETSDVHSARNRSRQKTATTTRISIQQWWQEWILMIISIGILIAIFVILRMYNNIPQPNWKFGLNLSTLIAVLATLLRSSLMSIVEEGVSTTQAYLLRLSLSQSLARLNGPGCAIDGQPANRHT
jgi:hypothetical protein